MIFGPDRQSDAYPLTPAADVRASRYIINGRRAAIAFDVRGLVTDMPPLRRGGISREEIADLELWGDAPFEDW